MLHSQRFPGRPIRAYRVAGGPDNAEWTLEQQKSHSSTLSQGAKDSYKSLQLQTSAESFRKNRQVRPSPRPVCLCSPGVLGALVFGGC